MDMFERQADEAAARGDHRAARALLVRAVETGPERVDLWLKSAAMHRATGDPTGAAAALDRALALSPLDFTALMMRATMLQSAGRDDLAGEAFGRALAQAPDPLPPQFRPVIDMARGRYRDWQSAQADRLKAAAAACDAASPRLDAMIEASLRLRAPDRAGPTHYCYPGLPETGFYDAASFEWIATLEAACDRIAAEFDGVMRSREAEQAPYIQYPETAPLEQWRTLNHNRDWTAIHLLNRGRTIEKNAALCPETMRILASIPTPRIAGAEPNAMFSLLAPHTHIPPHTGITNVRLVCHLPLIVPEGCWFRVGDERRAWRRGEAWVFDDTIEHEAMNPSDDLRVVLIVDLWHPELDERERRGIAAVIGAGAEVHGL